MSFLPLAALLVDTPCELRDMVVLVHPINLYDVRPGNVDGVRSDLFEERNEALKDERYSAVGGPVFDRVEVAKRANASALCDEEVRRKPLTTL